MVLIKEVALAADKEPQYCYCGLHFCWKADQAAENVCLFHADVHLVD